MKTVWKMNYDVPVLNIENAPAYVEGDTEEAARESLRGEWTGMRCAVRPGAVKTEITDDEYQNG